MEGCCKEMKKKVCDKCDGRGYWTNAFDEFFTCICKKVKHKKKEQEVYVVAVTNCESNETVCICKTKELAVRELFKKRDDMLAEWKEQDSWLEKQDRLASMDFMYKNMIKNLSSDDYEKWDNYPHDCPYIYKMKVIEK